MNVSDPDLLAQILRRRIKTDFDGNVSAAARSVGMSQPTLHRRAIGVINWAGRRKVDGSPMSRTVAKQIGQLLGKEQQKRFVEALASDDASRALKIYAKWNRLLQADALDDGRDSDWSSSPPWGKGWQGRNVEFKRLWTRLSDELPDIHTEFVEFFDLPLATPRNPNPVRGRRRESTIAVQRSVTSLYRIFLPLLEVKESAWIERRGVELSKAEFRRFVEYGWKREKILLSRAGDLQRAQSFPSLAELAIAAGPFLSDPSFNAPKKKPR